MTAPNTETQDYDYGERKVLTIPESVTIEREMISLEMAQSVLDEYNKVNRHLRDRRANDYARMMLTGDWMVNGDTIVFDTEDQLVNGQHTLKAQVTAGMDMEYLVVRGVQPECRPTVDAVAPRTLGDDLAMNGVTQANAKGALLRSILTWDTYGGQTRRHKARFQRLEIEKVWPIYSKEIDNTVLETGRWLRKYPGNFGACQFVWWLLYHRTRSDYKLVTKFFSILAIGSQDFDDEIVVRTRDLVLGLGKKHFGDEVYYLIRCWDLWVKHETIANGRKIPMPHGGLADPFPVPVTAQLRENRVELNG